MIKSLKNCMTISDPDIWNGQANWLQW